MVWLVTSFALLSVALVACGPVHAAWLVRMASRGRRPSVDSPSEVLPTISLIVPCHNEVELIADKVTNIKSLDYPRDRLEVIFVDGGSDDGTLERLQDLASEYLEMRVLSSKARGKIPQLNEALDLARGELTVNTDADALMAPDALVKLAGELAKHPDAWLAGAWTEPGQTTDTEKAFWQIHDRQRELESLAGLLVTVVAPCYAFRRELLDRFPDDVVADDVHVTLRAMFAGHVGVFAKSARAIEFRCPTTNRQLLWHKRRKITAVIRELLRFWPQLHRLPPAQRFHFVARVLQLTFVPVGTCLWLGLGIALCVRTVLGGVLLVVGGGTLIAASLLLTVGRGKMNLFSLGTAILTQLAASVLALLTFPFVRDSSAYRRIRIDKQPPEGSAGPSS